MAQEAAAFSEDPRTLAKLAWVRARVEFERGTPRHASEMVLDGAETVYDCDQEEAARMLIEMVRMAYSRRIRSHRCRPRCARSGPNSWE